MLPALFPNSSLTPLLFQAKGTDYYSSRSFVFLCLQDFAGGSLNGECLLHSHLSTEPQEKRALLQEVFPDPQGAMPSPLLSPQTLSACHTLHGRW